MSADFHWIMMPDETLLPGRRTDVTFVPRRRPYRATAVHVEGEPADLWVTALVVDGLQTDFEPMPAALLSLAPALTLPPVRDRMTVSIENRGNDPRRFCLWVGGPPRRQLRININFR